MQIELKNISYTYDGPIPVAALHNINLKVQTGEILGLIGHTGSGKSTLLQHLNGLLKPQEGDVLVDGKSVKNGEILLTKLRFRVGLVFQYPEYQLFEETIFKEVSFGPKSMGLKEEEIEKRVKQSLLDVGMGEEFYERSPFELSGGQKRRVALASILAMEPDILVLDEPTAGLDPRGRKEILDFLLKWRTDKRGIVLVSHNMEEMAPFAERIVVLHQGSIALDGTPEEVFYHAKELFDVGIKVPQISLVVNSLKTKGYNIDAGIFTVKEAAKAIYDALKDGGGRHGL
ncbi:MAG: energy-coupling factor transporter ATPase [Firmicutes bacterium]|nr:energy-coupling factor transporter ATPase [Bacillota bacterium]MDD4693367.1 energy-coupling factor transporter ATPase [Bacillota bacterium]